MAVSVKRTAEVGDGVQSDFAPPSELTEDEREQMLAEVRRILQTGQPVLCGQCRLLVYDPEWSEETGVTCKGCLPL